jgi:hypothetical protein
MATNQHTCPLAHGAALLADCVDLIKDDDVEL